MACVGYNFERPCCQMVYLYAHDYCSCRFYSYFCRRNKKMCGQICLLATTIKNAKTLRVSKRRKPYNIAFLDLKHRFCKEWLTNVFAIPSFFVWIAPM